jgi:hypothetical protein
VCIRAPYSNWALSGQTPKRVIVLPRASRGRMVTPCAKWVRARALICSTAIVRSIIYRSLLPANPGSSLVQASCLGGNLRKLSKKLSTRDPSHFRARKVTPSLRTERKRLVVTV